MRDRLINITGNTATGTTTLAKRLNQLVGWQAVYSENYLNQSPFFAKFLQEPSRWTFHNQVFFIAEYIEGYRVVTQSSENEDRIVCLDYTAYELVIYTEAMRAKGFLDLDEYRTLRKIFGLLELTLRIPDLLIYLTARIDVLIGRIQKRSRSVESEMMDKDYLEVLQRSFGGFIASWTRGPVLKIDSEKTDFLHDDDVVRLIAAQALNKMV